MSTLNTPPVNFTTAQETSAHKSLAIVAGILAVVFTTLAVLRVDSVLGPDMWIAFAIACTAGTGIFLLMLSVDKEKQAKSH